MNSFFSSDSFLTAGLRRSRRTRTRKPAVVRSKNCPSSSVSGKFLHIIPEMSEEEEYECSSAFYASVSDSSCSSLHSPISPYIPSRSVGGSHTLGLKSTRGPVAVKVTDIRIPKPEEVQLGISGISDVHNLLNEDELILSSELPRPAPRPPTSIRPTSPPAPSSNSDRSAPSSADSFQVTFPGGVSLDFPHPPLPTPSSMDPSLPPPRRSFEFDNKRSGSVSPSPSASSSSSQSTSHCTSSPESCSAGLPTTPTSSDDEDCLPSPRVLPRRMSIRPLFIAKSVPELRHDTQLPEFSPQISKRNAGDECEWLDDGDEANEWYTREFSEILTLCSPIPPSFPARPESMFVPNPPSPAKPKVRSRLSKPLPDIPIPISRPMPSAQLDPAFPRRKRSIPPMPKRAPPPPPVITTPPTPLQSRPPPRVSIPADIGLFDIELDLSPATGDAQSSFESNSSGSVYSQEGDFEVELDLGRDFDLDLPMRLPLSLPTSPVDLELDIATGLEELARAREGAQASPLSPAIPETPIGQMYAPLAEPSSFARAQSEEYPQGERVLRSRWSSSTLSSVREQDLRIPESASRMLKFYFGSKIGRGKAPATPTTPASPIAKRMMHARGLSTDSDLSPGGLRRRGSRSSSSAGSDSGESIGSAGLRRKPIPVEMFIRC